MSATAVILFAIYKESLTISPSTLSPLSQADVVLQEAANTVLRPYRGSTAVVCAFVFIHRDSDPLCLPHIVNSLEKSDEDGVWGKSMALQWVHIPTCLYSYLPRKPRSPDGVGMHIVFTHFLVLVVLNCSLRTAPDSGSNRLVAAGEQSCPATAGTLHRFVHSSNVAWF